MLLLTSTSDIIRVVTGAAGAVQVHASYVDNATGSYTPARTNTPTIATATTTTVVASPAASTQRNVKYLGIHNTSTTVTNQVTVQHFDGTTPIDVFNCTLLPDEHLIFNEGGDWIHSDAQGGQYTYQVPASANLGMTGVFAETMPRETCPEVNTVAPTASGTLFLQAIYLTAGQTVSNIILSSATTAAVTPTGGRAGLYDINRNLKATSADQTTTAWAANTVKTLAMVTPYKVPTSGLYYICFYMAATTIITTKGGTTKTNGALAQATPILHGTSTTGLTTTLPDPAAAITISASTIYAAVS